MSTYIRGVGTVSPLGVGTEQTWRAAVVGCSGLVSTKSDDGPQVGGQLIDFDPGNHLPRRLSVQTDRWAQFGLVAAEEAIAMSGVDWGALDPAQISVVTASSSGGNHFGQVEIEKLWRSGPSAVGAYQSIAWFYAAMTGQLSIRHGFKGRCGVLVNGSAGGLDAIATADRWLLDAPGVALVGGFEAPFSPFALACLYSGGGVSASGRTKRAYRPYHSEGYVPGEGGALLVLGTDDCDLPSAQTVVEIGGTASGFCSETDDSRVVGRVAATAIDRAGLKAADIDVIFADASGLAAPDASELTALSYLFLNGNAPPISVPKTMTGRLASGGGILDVALAYLALQHQELPATINISDADLPAGMSFAIAGPALLSTALVLARGSGGFISALVLKRQPTNNHVLQNNADL